MTLSVSRNLCMHATTDCIFTAVLTSKFPSLTNAPSLIHSMNAQWLFKQGKTSEKVTTLLKCVQFADLGSPDINEDNTGPSWGHYQFMAGGVSLSSSLTTWEDVGSVSTAFELVAATLKMCQEARCHDLDASGHGTCTTTVCLLILIFLCVSPCSILSVHRPQSPYL